MPPTMLEAGLILQVEERGWRYATMLPVLLSVIASLVRIQGAYTQPSSEAYSSQIQQGHRFLSPSSRTTGKAVFLEGNLGRIPVSQQGLQSSDLKHEGIQALKSILVEFLGGNGDEDVQPAPNQILLNRKQNNGFQHIRYHHYMEGTRVRGASMVLHVSEQDGTIHAANGEFAPIHENSTVT